MYSLANRCDYCWRYFGDKYILERNNRRIYTGFCQTPVLGLGLGVDYTFAWDNHNNNPHLNFVKGIVLGDKEQGITNKGKWIRDKG